LGGFLPFAARLVEAAFLVLGGDDEASAVPGCIVQRLVGCSSIHEESYYLSRDAWERVSLLLLEMSDPVWLLDWRKVALSLVASLDL
jgi:hypothetical protein